MIEINVNEKKYNLVEMKDLTRLSIILEKHFDSNKVNDSFDEFLKRMEDIHK